MRISSIYPILQGEGINSGVPQVMIRLAGCLLPYCAWCDAPDAINPKSGQEMTVDEVFHTTLNLLDSINWVTISGGEPLVQLEAFCQLVIKLSPFDIEVATSGRLPPPPEEIISAVRLWVVDYKCSSSRISSPEIAQWVTLVPSNKGCFKFVVGSEADLEFALQRRIPQRVNILSPVTLGIKEIDGQIVVSQEQTEWNRRVAKFAVKHGFRLSVQTHKIIWGDRQDK